MKTLLLLLVMASQAFAGTVSGRIVLSSGKSIAGGTAAFTLSQVGYVSGSYVVAASTSSCYTTSDGSLVGEPDPLIAPIVTGNYGSGTLAAGTYYLKYTYYDATGETLASPETVFTMTGIGTMNIALPALVPSAATGIKVYISTATGTETLQGTATFVAGVSFAQSGALASGTALPATNSSTCQVIFNDTIIPARTTYAMTMVDASGSSVPGFPQNYYLQGSSVVISSVTPSGNTTASFPQAIVAVPSNHASQSISGPLSLGAYMFTAANIESIHFADRFAGASVAAQIDACFADFSVGLCAVPSSVSTGNPTSYPDSKMLLDLRSGNYELDVSSTSDYVNHIRFEQGLNPSANSTLNQFGQTTELFTYAANSKTFTGQQNAVYGSFSHFGTGALTSGYGGVFESFNSGAATAALIVGVSATANNGGVTAGVPAQTPTNNGTATNVRAVDGIVKNASSGVVTNGATFYAEGVRNTGGGTVTNGWGLFVADQTVASNNWAIQTGLGKVQFGDNVLASKSIGVGTSAPTSDALYIQPVANLSGTTQYGVRSIPQTSSAATAFGIGVYGRADTQSAAYTQTNNAAIYAATPTKGGGSAITNNYGLYIESIAGGVNNWAILALGAKSEFDGGIQVGATGTPILKYIEGTVVQDLASIPANTCSDTNAITVTGALDGDVAAGSALAAVASTAGLSITAYVSASDAAKVRVCNVTTGAIDPPSTTYRAGVWVH